MAGAAAPRNSPARRGGEGKPRPSPARRAALGLLVPIVCLCGCGLENVNFYSPPTFVNSGNLMTLTHDSTNSDSNFLGYDIYYRAFPTLAEADTSRTAIENASSQTTATPEGLLSQLKNQGYKKIYLETPSSVEPTPLLKGATSYYSIQLPSNDSSTNWYYATNDSPTTNIQIVRGTGNGESFNSPYTIGQIDYASTSTAVGSGGSIYIVAFGIAYGYDITKLTAIYSFPASLNQAIGGSSGYTLP
jgi:hypothetical protein